MSAELLEQQLRGRPIFFRGIAGLAARDDIPPGAAPAPCQRHNMIHGQCTGRKRALTVCTDALGNFIAPPLRGTQGFRFGFFAGDMAWIFVNVNPICQESSFGLRPYNPLTCPTVPMKRVRSVPTAVNVAPASQSLLSPVNDTGKRAILPLRGRTGMPPLSDHGLCGTLPVSSTGDREAREASLTPTGLPVPFHQACYGAVSAPVSSDTDVAGLNLELPTPGRTRRTHTKGMSMGRAKHYWVDADVA